MRVLVGCEQSGIVRDAFIKKGHDAMSCDLKPANGNHFQGSIFDIDNFIQGKVFKAFDLRQLKTVSAFITKHNL